MDVNRDGRTDLVAEFDEVALVRNGDLALGNSVLVLLGRFRGRKAPPWRGAVEATP